MRLGCIHFERVIDYTLLAYDLSIGVSWARDAVLQVGERAKYVYWMSSYWSVGKSNIHICRVKRLRNAGECLERWISAVLHLLFSMTHNLSASGELLIGSKKSAVKCYDSSPLWYKMRVMLLGCLECYVNQKWLPVLLVDTCEKSESFCGE